MVNIRKVKEKGRKLPKSVCEKMSKSKKGIPQKKIECPHCGKIGGTTMYRWHFDNCKYKEKVDENIQASNSNKK